MGETGTLEAHHLVKRFYGHAAVSDVSFVLRPGEILGYLGPAAAWGVWIASMHAFNGAALGWLLVEIACGDTEQPLVRTVPPNDALNTVGAVFLGAIVIAVFILARIERLLLTSGVASVIPALVMVSSAMWVRHIHERDHRAATSLPAYSGSVQF